MLDDPGTASVSPAAQEEFRSSRSLRTNVSWSVAGNVVYAGCQGGILIVLARLGSSEMVGQFALALAVCSPVILFTNLQLRVVQATDATHEYDFGNYAGLRLICTSLALLVIAAIILMVEYPRQTALTIFVVGMAKAIESLSDVIYGLLQQHERLDLVARSMLIKGPLSLVALGGLVLATANVLWGVIGLAVAWACLLIGHDLHCAVMVLRASQRSSAAAKGRFWKSVVRLKPHWQGARLGNLAWLALPLGIVMMLVSLSANIPRYVIERVHGEGDLGVFAALAYLMVIGGTLVDAFIQSASPRLAKHYARGDLTAFRALLYRMLGLGGVLGGLGVFVAVVAGRQLLTLLYGPEYAAHAMILPWIMTAAGIGYISAFAACAISATRSFRVQAAIHLAGAIVALGASALLIPKYGLFGAAWVMCFMFAAKLPFQGLVISRTLKHGNLQRTQ